MFVVDINVLKIMNPIMSYEKMIEASKGVSSGDIPFGQYLLYKGILTYSIEKGISIEDCINSLRDYSPPLKSITYRDISKATSCCGGGQIK